VKSLCANIADVRSDAASSPEQGSGDFMKQPRIIASCHKGTPLSDSVKSSLLYYTVPAPAMSPSSHSRCALAPHQRAAEHRLLVGFYQKHGHFLVATKKAKCTWASTSAASRCLRGAHWQSNVPVASSSFTSSARSPLPRCHPACVTPPLLRHGCRAPPLRELPLHLLADPVHHRQLQH
jgi:hypothetical protein